MSKEIKRVVGIGELLWDIFPSGLRLGGAPLNFCYHCRQLGAEAYPVSAVGGDEFGVEIREVIGSRQLTDRFVAEDATRPTGAVQVELDDCGKPKYKIKEQVAWDYIPMSGNLKTLAQTTDALCFGSLAQRNGVSRKTILTFVRATPTDALKIFDVNLRQTFFSKEIIEESLRLSNVLKLSDEELPLVAGMFGISGPVQAQLHGLLERFDLQLIAYTRGADGSLLVTPDESDDHPGCPGEAINSVGAGDAFTATLCMGLLSCRPLNEINEYANRVASFVCRQDSATPELTDNLNEAHYA
ncbi:Fructokinase [Pontiella desulfatans]|uniref:Fructokinase n=1 Tax=Pontiella desulfatans TaxID=2750659 RepID=A0A6C2UA63_PONDE|nr:carbohydrate kinase [Pontiella desulfatans]VGO16885.1 Fructokinase [Pontiella desulfatans]